MSFFLAFTFFALFFFLYSVFLILSRVHARVTTNSSSGSSSITTKRVASLGRRIEEKELFPPPEVRLSHERQPLREIGSTVTF
ncbi:hypothetical protein V8C44DRAFT_325574 [Trichoderma aethiopicum]